jgi:hypothetical protein
MPILVTNNTFLDIFGVSRSYYKANAGDYQRLKIDIEESISVTSSVTTNLQLNIPLYEITWLGGDFENEGFRPGDLIALYIWDNTGVLINSYTANIVWVNGNTFKISTLLGWYDSTNGETIQIAVLGRKREGLKINVNHVANGSAGSEFSLIDGESTTFLFDLTGSFPVVGSQVGKRSGQFETNVSVDLLSTTSTTRQYRVSIDLTQSGVYTITPFNFTNCLKSWVRFSWQSLLGEPYSNTQNVVNDDANTGWFDEAFNLDVLDASLVQGITDIYFNQPTTGQFVVDSTSTNYAIGSAYIPGDDAYFKNNYNNQSELAMLIPTQTFVLGSPIASYVNPTGADYTLQIDNVSIVGTQYTFDFTFTPGPSFEAFINAQADTDRLFYIWLRIGNVNLLVYSDQLREVVPVGGPLTLVSSEYYDHSQNTTTALGNLNLGYEANVEDDLAFVGAFQLPYGVDCSNFYASIEAFNSVTNETFTLQQSAFAINSVPMVAGKYILNLSTPIFTDFQTTSQKINGLLELDSTFDSIGVYGVKIYFPFLYNWRYWLAQLNADADFYPNDQTQNWVPYGNTGNWNLRVKLELIKSGLSFVYTDDIIIKDYDSDPNIFQEIELIRESTGQIVNAVIIGEVMRIRAKHTNLDLSFWDNPNVWTQITIEPTEGAPRYWCSSIVPFDGNTLNPLSPETGVLMPINYPQPYIAVSECLFDTSKLNLSNGVKISAKIKGCTISSAKGKMTNAGPDTPAGFKMTTDGFVKMIN